MTDLTLRTESTLNGLELAVLENELLRITILPGAGARIWQITYKPLQVDLLWNNPNLLPSAQPLFASYDDNWTGGWDELFPNDEAVELQGLTLPDHGELWTGTWTSDPLRTQDAEGVHLSFRTPITHFLAEKDVMLRTGSSVLEIRYKLTNEGAHSLPFLWKLHPAFAVSPSHRLDFPPMTVVRELGFPGTLDGVAATFSWPFAPLQGGELDLRQIPDVSSRALHFFYGTELAAGWCGMTDRSKKLAAALRFDPNVFSTCWLFATHGGWNDLNVAVLEPATGYPYQMKTMIERGQARILEPGECLETTVHFTVREGISSIGSVDEDGAILPGDEG